MEQAAALLKERGIEVVNCSTPTALKCFPIGNVFDFS
jgi:hypothetical protein